MRIGTDVYLYQPGGFGGLGGILGADGAGGFGADGAAEEGAPNGELSSKSCLTASRGSPHSAQTLSIGLLVFPHFGHVFIDISVGLKHIYAPLIHGSHWGQTFFLSFA